MLEVPRDRFVPEKERRRSYADSALPIGSSQTISQPWIVAAICQALELRGDERVLEIGTGSGYSAAVLASLASAVITIERHGDLAEEAVERLREVGTENGEVIVGDGSRGLPERAPFDAIAVHATAPGPPISLIDQLTAEGTLVVPVAARGADMLTQYRRSGEEIRTELIGPCRFVPLIGEEGFSD